MYTYNVPDLSEHEKFERIIWNNDANEMMIQDLETKLDIFENLTQSLLNGSMQLDDCIDNLSNIVYEISFKFHGKSFFKHSKPKKRKKSEWFDSGCKLAKDTFYKYKRMFKLEPTDNQILLFLYSRSYYCNVKRMLNVFIIIKKRLLLVI